MVLVSSKASAPGSMMLFGEHAVLHGRQAIVAAVDQRITVELKSRTDQKVNLYTPLGDHQTSLAEVVAIAPWEYLLTAIRLYLPCFTNGFDLIVNATLPASIGLGSSAAVIVATIGCIEYYLYQRKPDAMLVYAQCMKVLRQVQGVGSGADIAATIFGGIVAYCNAPVGITKLTNSLPLVAIYSGKKLATKIVIEQVAALREKFPEIVATIFANIDNCAKAAINAIKQNDLMQLGQLMNIHHGLQHALGVDTAILAELVFTLRGMPNIYGAKISGSGLGDCVLGLGAIPPAVFPQNQTQQNLGVRQLQVPVAKEGLRIEGMKPGAATGV